MVFAKGSRFLESAMKEFVSGYKGDVWGQNGDTLAIIMRCSYLYLPYIFSLRTEIDDPHLEKNVNPIIRREVQR